MKTDAFQSFKICLIQYLESAGVHGVYEKMIKILETNTGDFTLHTLQIIDQDILKNMKSCSQNWSLLIENVSITNNQIFISLNRPSTFLNILRAVYHLSEQYGTPQIFNEKKIHLSDDPSALSSDDLTSYRIKLLIDVAKNLSCATGLTLSEANDDDELLTGLLFTHKSNFNASGTEAKPVLCGVVQNSLTKNKESKITFSQLKQMKKDSLASKVEDRELFSEDTVEKLTDAVIKYDLLRVRISSPVVMDFNTSSGDESTSGTAVFILYNYSRLNAILHEFEARVEQRRYPSLPEIESVDFNLLREEKEWDLLLKFIMYFPTVVRSCIEFVTEGKFSPHLLCNFLHALARTISSYYRSTKILLDDKPHLFPLIFARIHLIKAVHRVLYNGLNLLTIQPVPAL